MPGRADWGVCGQSRESPVRSAVEPRSKSGAHLRFYRKAGRLRQFSVLICKKQIFLLGAYRFRGLYYHPAFFMPPAEPTPPTFGVRGCRLRRWEFTLLPPQLFVWVGCEGELSPIRRAKFPWHVARRGRTAYNTRARGTGAPRGPGQDERWLP